MERAFIRSYVNVNYFSEEFQGVIIYVDWFARQFTIRKARMFFYLLHSFSSHFSDKNMQLNVNDVHDATLLIDK